MDAANPTRSPMTRKTESVPSQRSTNQPMPPQTSTPETSVPMMDHAIPESPLSSPPSGRPGMGGGSIATCGNAPSARSAWGGRSPLPMRLTRPRGGPFTPGRADDAPDARDQSPDDHQDGEGDGGGRDAAAADVGQAQGRAGQDRRPQVHEQHRLAVTVAHLLQLVVDVRLVGREHRTAFAQ